MGLIEFIRYLLMLKQLAFNAGYQQGLKGQSEDPQWPWWTFNHALRSSFLSGFTEAMYEDNEDE